jgi:PKD repeat protein
MGLLLVAFALTGCFHKNQLPVAKAQASPTQGTAPLTVQFRADESMDPDGQIIEYQWDFGDGSTGFGVTTSHTYTREGTYEVTLTVKDNRGAAATDDLTITVSKRIVAPVAAISATPTQGVAPLTVQFDGGRSADADGQIISYRWDFGDGTTADEAQVSHTYTTAGTYTVTLSVRDNDGAEGRAQIIITVSPRPVVTTQTDRTENEQLVLERTYPSAVEVGRAFTITLKVTAKVNMDGLILSEFEFPSGLEKVEGEQRTAKLRVGAGDTLTLTYKLRATTTGQPRISGHAAGVLSDGTQIELPLSTQLEVRPAAP